MAAWLQSFIALRIPLPGHWRRSLPVVAMVAFGCCWAPAVNAQNGKPTICCRTSGGTRSTCLNVWAHLVPPSNRFNPGSNRTLALLQGPSSEPTAMTVQLLAPTGELVAGHTVQAQRVGITLITLPQADRPALNQALTWESFPSCQPNKPPTRTSLVAERNPEQIASQKLIADLGHLCGKSADTKPLLTAFNLDDYETKLPAKLPIQCEKFVGNSPGSR